MRPTSRRPRPRRPSGWSPSPRSSSTPWRATSPPGRPTSSSSRPSSAPRSAARPSPSAIWRPALKRAGLSRRHHPRPAALLREPAHPARRVGEDGPGPAGARQRRRDARHLQPSLARLRRPDEGRRRLRARSSLRTPCGLTPPADRDKRRSAGGDGRVGLYAGFCPRVPRGLPMGGHPSRPVVAGRLERSTRRLGRAALERLRRTAANRRPFLTLLRVGFTEPHRSPGVRWSLTPPFHPYQPPCRSSAAGGLFSVALSRGSPRVAVNDHPALWSPDVPRRRGLPRRRDRPADSSVVVRTLDGDLTGQRPRGERAQAGLMSASVA